MATKADIRSLAREITDLDTEDVSNVVLDSYIRDGYRRIIAHERRWPFFEVTTSLPTVAEQRAYAVASIGDGDLREVVSLVNNDASGERLVLVSHDDAEGRWLGSGDSASRPLFWSLWGGEIHLWPKPDAVYTLAVRGYRQPTAWFDSEGGEIDADERLHDALVYYAVSKLYQLQEDFESAADYRASFEEAVELARRDIMRVESHRPLVLSAGRITRHDRYTDELRRSVY